MNMPSDQASAASERGRLLAKAISRWDNEGGAGEGGRVPDATPEFPADAPALTNAELVQLQIRVIALENLLVALLVDASDQQRDLALELAEGITPRPGFTPHRLTIHAAARIVSLVERSRHLRLLQSTAERIDDPRLSGRFLDMGSAD